LKVQQWATVINKNSVEGCSEKKNRGGDETEWVKAVQQWQLQFSVSGYSQRLLGSGALIPS